MSSFSQNRFKSICLILACVLFLASMVFMAFSFGPNFSDVVYMPWCVGTLFLSCLFVVLAMSPSVETWRLYRHINKLPFALFLFLPFASFSQLQQAQYDPGADTVSIYDQHGLSMRITPSHVWAKVDDSTLVDFGEYSTGGINNIKGVIVYSFMAPSADPAYFGYVVVARGEDYTFLASTLTIPDWGVTVAGGEESLRTLYEKYANASVGAALLQSAHYRLTSCLVEACALHSPVCECAIKYDLECHETAPAAQRH